MVGRSTVLLNGTGTVGLPCVAIPGFIRIATNPGILENHHSLEVSRAISRETSWLVRPQVLLIHPGDRHAEFLFDLLRRVGSAGNLTTDAHLAALAIEHQAGFTRPMPT